MPRANRRWWRRIAASTPTAWRPRAPTKARPRRWPNCRRASTPKPGSPPCAATSTATAASPHRCGPKPRRWRGEAELADRRLQAITAERTEWQNRKGGAASQIETIEARVTDVTAERAELDNAPAVFAEKRRALIGEIESAETAAGSRPTRWPPLRA